MHQHEIAKFTLIAHEPRRADPNDPNLIHCMCGSWFDNHYIWVAHVARACVEPDPGPEVAIARDHYYHKHHAGPFAGCDLCTNEADA